MKHWLRLLANSWRIFSIKIANTVVTKAYNLYLYAQECDLNLHSTHCFEILPNRRAEKPPTGFRSTACSAKRRFRPSLPCHRQYRIRPLISSSLSSRVPPELLRPCNAAQSIKCAALQGFELMHVRCRSNESACRRHSSGFLSGRRPQPIALIAFAHRRFAR